MLQVTQPITMMPTDTDTTLMDKVAERIGRKIRFVDWFGESGSGVKGTMYLEVAGGGEPERIPFRAQAKPGVGGAFEIGEWIVPYVEFGYSQDPEKLLERLEIKLSRDGNLDKKVN